MDNQNDMEEILKAIGLQMKKCSRFSPEKEGFEKVTGKLAEELDRYLALVPQILCDDLTKDAYRVIYDKGLGTLQKAKEDGFFRAAVVGKKGNNDIKGAALLQSLNGTEEILANCFAIMAVIVGQYYMKKIDSKFESIEDRLTQIEQFLKDDKRAELMSEATFLDETQKNIRFIISNETHRQSTLSSIQRIKIDMMKSINLFKMQIERLQPCKEDEKKDKVDEAIRKATDIMEMMSEYWYSVYLYIYASSLEPVLAGNTNEEYLDNMVSSMMKCCEDYKEDYAKWHEVLLSYEKSLKALDKNKVLDVLKKLSDIDAGANPYLLFWQGVGVVAEKTSESDKKKKKEKREQFEGIINAEGISNIDLMMEKVNDVIRFNMFNNRRFEVVKHKGEIYIKREDLLKDDNMVKEGKVIETA